MCECLCARTHKHKTHTQARECLVDDIGFLDEVPRACKPEGMPTYPSTHELPKGAKKRVRTPPAATAEDPGPDMSP